MVPQEESIYFTQLIELAAFVRWHGEYLRQSSVQQRSII
jgi:hypothetical protein